MPTDRSLISGESEHQSVVQPRMNLAITNTDGKTRDIDYELLTIELVLLAVMHTLVVQVYKRLGLVKIFGRAWTPES